MCNTMVDTMQSRMQLVMDSLKTMAKLDEELSKIEGEKEQMEKSKKQTQNNIETPLALVEEKIENDEEDVVSKIEADDEKRKEVAKGCIESMQFLLDKATGKTTTAQVEPQKNEQTDLLPKVQLETDLKEMEGQQKDKESEKTLKERDEEKLAAINAEFMRMMDGKSALPEKNTTSKDKPTQAGPKQIELKDKEIQTNLKVTSMNDIKENVQAFNAKSVVKPEERS